MEVVLLLVIAVVVVSIALILEAMFTGKLEQYQGSINKGLTWAILIVGLIMVAFGGYLFLVWLPQQIVGG